jgi:hypothetical protein
MTHLNEIRSLKISKTHANIFGFFHDKSELEEHISKDFLTFILLSVDIGSGDIICLIIPKSDGLILLFFRHRDNGRSKIS